MPRSLLPVALGWVALLTSASTPARGADPPTPADASSSPAAVAPAPGPTSVPRFLRPPSPNPSLGAVTFAISNPRLQDLEVSIFDLRGRRLAVLWSGRLVGGESTFRWNGESRSGRRAAAGLYVVRLRTPSSASARLFALLE